MLNIPEMQSLSSMSDLKSFPTESIISGMIGMTEAEAPSPIKARPIIITQEASIKCKAFEGPHSQRENTMIKNPSWRVVLFSKCLVSFCRTKGPSNTYEIVGTAKQIPIAQVGKWNVLRSLGAKIGSPKVKIIKLKNWQMVPKTILLYLKRATMPTSLAP